MAIIPKYQQRRTLPGTTGQQMAPLSIVGKSPLQTIGEAGMAISGVLSEAAQRVQARENVVQQEKVIDAFTMKSQEDFNAFLESEDISDTKNALPKFHQLQEASIAKAVSGFSGTPEQKADLEKRLRGYSRGVFANMSSIANREQDAYIGTKIGEQADPFMDMVGDDPSKLREATKGLDDLVERYAPQLRPSQQDAWKKTLHGKAVKRAMNKYLTIGSWEKAKELKAANPDVFDRLSEDEREDIDDAIFKLEERETQSFRQGQAARNFLRGALNREPTEAEVASRIGTLGANKKVSALTEFGKFEQNVANDRALIVQRNGGNGNADEVRRFDAWAAQERQEMMKGEVAPVSEVSSMRKEYMKSSEDFPKMRASYEQINALSKDETGASDIGMVFSLMKLFDPNSSVRESEYATAQNASGVPEWLRGQWGKVRDGAFLSPEARKQFVATAKTLMRARNDQQKILNETYTGLSERNNYPVSDVVVFDVYDDKDLESVQGSTFGRPEATEPGDQERPAMPNGATARRKQRRDSKGGQIDTADERPVLTFGADGTFH